MSSVWRPASASDTLVANCGILLHIHTPRAYLPPPILVASHTTFARYQIPLEIWLHFKIFSRAQYSWIVADNKLLILTVASDALSVSCQAHSPLCIPFSTKRSNYPLYTLCDVAVLHTPWSADRGKVQIKTHALLRCD